MNGTSYFHLVPLLAALVTVEVAGGADHPVMGVKLIVIDNTAVAGKAKVVFVTKDASVTKGLGTDPATIAMTLDVTYDSTSGAFDMPQGADWLVNKSTVAKYVHKTAPTGGAVKVGVVKPAKLAKVVGRSLGDPALDVSSPPSGPVYVAATVLNGASVHRLCTRFNVCVHKAIAAGSGWKLVCKGNSVGGPTCQASGCLVDRGSTVLDTCTGLQWEKKETSPGLHAVYDVYSWAGVCTLNASLYCQPNSAAAATCAAQTGRAVGCDECGVGDGTCDTDPLPSGATTTVWDWLNQVNAASFGGHADWRLGDSLELQSIVDPTQGFCGGGLSTEAYVDPLFDPTVAAYYCSDSTAPDPANARIVNFSDGNVYDGGKGTGLGVRAVRPGS